MSTKSNTYFQHLMKRDHAGLMEDEESEESDYPGTTPPRNRSDSPKSKTIMDEVLATAKFTRYKVRGELREFYSIGELAKLLHRKAVTIRKWESSGWIPHANYRTPAPKGVGVQGGEPKGRRLYSREQVIFLLTAVEAYRLNEHKKADWTGFKKHTSTQWPV
jgi:hypothetical protein